MSNTVITNRELSWLSFNERVLMEAEDRSNPLLERLKFLAIFSSNLDEFFMVRVSGLREQVIAGYDKVDPSGNTPRQQLDAISENARKLCDMQQHIYATIQHELSLQNIIFASPDMAGLEDIVETIFFDEIMSVISPVTIDPAHPFPFIYNRRLSLLVELEKAGKQFYSLIMIPDTLRRVYISKQGRKTYILTIEDIIRHNIGTLYKGYTVIRSDLFRVTRDADLDVGEEESADLLRLIQDTLTLRKKGDVTRVEVEHSIPVTSLKYLEKKVGFTINETYYVRGRLDLTFLFAIAGLKPSLNFPALVHRPIQNYNPANNIFDQIKKQPIYFMRPYNSFEIVPNLLAQAAKDPDVLAIKMTLYRTNKNSRIMAALLDAAKHGKQVSVVVELKARFDEERNIEGAKSLEQAGCIVTYGIVGLKIHAKCMLIVRKEKNKIVRYTHIATGNYNEITANIYTDVDVITASEDIGRDATQLFNFLMGYSEEKSWRRLAVAPHTLRPTVTKLINDEIEYAKQGKPARIIMKMNSLIDDKIIELLYSASQAGVKIDIIVRGICGLQPGVEGLSENIKVRSIIGRFLEHSRIIYTSGGNANGGRYFITSADMMPRNLNGRVEIMTELLDENFKQYLGKILEISLKDNCKAWELKGDKYSKIRPAAGEEHISSQDYFLNNDI